MAWGIVFYCDATGTAPAHAFLDDCPAKVAATFIAVLDAVRANGMVKANAALFSDRDYKKHADQGSSVRPLGSRRCLA